ncbi:serine threonine- kinase receptor R831 [Chlorella sorokiniana]|uniref:Serine threonine-kinase receptor R831 n=1 Tax=Chlorella sorokiniana TaxID=3076 RepID=A0A2P6TN27_CHLSO|nr:serine threonine- kinase receptor R831 [Chlorella sorokiniana]|eukprot:PRW45736.1 serine threonine- kinase receptor R831 [Chlorella sorokiniana]
MMRRRAQWLAAILLALLLPAGAAPAVGPATLEQERDIMLALRLSMEQARPTGAPMLRFWNVNSSAALHCTWDLVMCNREGYVTSLTVDVRDGSGAAASSESSSSAGSGGNAGSPQAGKVAETDRSSDPPPGPLLPALARLSQLKALVIEPVGTTDNPFPLGVIPAEWGHPGAFPALTNLAVTVHQIAGRLPVIHPGALPQLLHLQIEATQFNSSLPASWSDPGVLPSLLGLSLTLNLEGGLPPSWSRGFKRLLDLRIGQGQPSWRYRSLPRPQGSSLRLPPEWAGSSAFPKLQNLELVGLPLGGSLPAEWVRGGFPALFQLMVSPAQLTGTLPPDIFARHPNLLSLGLSGNWMHGTLPSSYGRSKAWSLQFAHNPNITGPALPAAWLEVGALPHLIELDLSGCPVTGTLPPTLPWPILETLKLDGTRLEGSISESWCSQPFAASLHKLWLNGTAANATRPACAAHDMRWLDSPISVNATASPASPAVQGVQGARTSAALPAALGALLPLAAFAVGSRLLMRRRPCRTQQAPQEPGSDSLLPTELQTLPGSSGSSNSDERLRAQLPAARRQRLAALLSKRPAGTIEMLPFGEIERYAILAHQLEFVAGEDGRLVSLGSGTQGDVFLARLDAVQVAVKVIELGALLNSGRVWQEVGLLRRATHPRIVKLLGVGMEDGMILIATELMPRGNLRLLLRDPETRKELRWRRHGCQVALDVAEALDYMHTQQRMLHSDIKCANVLLDHEWRASVSDFGLSQVLSNASRTAVGFSRVYAAPEVLLGQRCTLAADVHSFGVLLAFLLVGQVSEKRGHWRLPRAPEECPQAVVQLISDCTLPQPQQRPVAAQILAHLREAAEQDGLGSS